MSNLEKYKAYCAERGIEQFVPDPVLRVQVRRVEMDEGTLPYLYKLRALAPECVNPNLVLETVDGVTSVWERVR